MIFEHQFSLLKVLIWLIMFVQKNLTSRQIVMEWPFVGVGGMDQKTCFHMLLKKSRFLKNLVKF